MLDELLIVLSRHLKAQQDQSAAATYQDCATSDTDEVPCNCQTTMRPNSIKATTESKTGAIPKSPLTPQQLISQGNGQDGRQQYTCQPAWDSTEVQMKPQPQNVARRRSLSAPNQNSRDCQRGADKFCCSTGTGSCSYEMNNTSFEPQRQEPTCHMNDSSRIGMNYDQWLLQQQQQQQKRQQSIRCLRKEDSYDDFDPGLNSTMIDQDYRRNAGRPSSCSIQQQQQHLRQQHFQQQHKQQSSFRSQYGQNQGEACCMPQQPTSATNQGQYSSQQRMVYPDLQCQVRHDINNSYNETSYRQQPQQSQGAQGMQKSAAQQVTFRDEQTIPICQASRSTSAYPVDTSYQSNLRMKQGSRCNQTTDICSGLNQSNMNKSDAPMFKNLYKSKIETCQDSQDRFDRPSMPLNDMTHEDLHVLYTQTVFFNTMVLDNNCPGIIQQSLNGRENFNEYAFKIAFGNNIPNEPRPIDPMTMLEAIKNRIDYEREEIHKKCPISQDESEGSSRRHKNRDSRHDSNRDRSTMSIERDKDFYYYKNKDAKKRRRAQTDTTAQELMREDIDRHFSTKNKSDVNDSISAFLKAENDYSNSPGHSSKNFSANVNSHESNFLGLPIKMKIYNATTWPTD